MKPRVVQFYFPIFGTLFIPIDKVPSSSSVNAWHWTCQRSGSGPEKIRIL